MTVYRRPDPIPLRRSRASSDPTLHAVRTEPEDLNRLVSRQIFTAISHHAYPEGSILPNEETLSRELGVSRTALRESVKGLVAKGVLETKRRRGTLVLPKSTWNMFDADIIAWLGREDAQSVASQLLDTLRIAVPGAAALTAQRRAGATLAKARLGAGEESLEARVEFLHELGAASHNSFLASLISSAIRGVLETDRRQLEDWLTWMTPSVANVIAEKVRRGDADISGYLAGELSHAQALV